MGTEGVVVVVVVVVGHTSLLSNKRLPGFDVLCRLLLDLQVGGGQGWRGWVERLRGCVGGVGGCGDVAVEVGVEVLRCC